ncbi:hypothetical protein GEV33_008634 [Tenebrio molitor]|uniref:Uncharacterized protein n=1 Tax=Tenebrio molitor TaxID=7067 RepID=A0A8J6HH64_TENMO|nr:hypothetical protein GEV33_008634 [Tenebrio molitor]
MITFATLENSLSDKERTMVGDNKTRINNSWSLMMKAVQETSLSLLNFPRRHSDHDKERRVARARQTIALQHSTTTTGENDPFLWATTIDVRHIMKITLDFPFSFLIIECYFHFFLSSSFYSYKKIHKFENTSNSTSGEDCEQLISDVDDDFRYFVVVNDRGPTGKCSGGAGGSGDDGGGNGGGGDGDDVGGGGDELPAMIPIIIDNIECVICNIKRNNMLRRYRNSDSTSGSSSTVQFRVHPNFTYTSKEKSETPSSKTVVGVTINNEPYYRYVTAPANCKKRKISMRDQHRLFNRKGKENGLITSVFLGHVLEKDSARPLFGQSTEPDPCQNRNLLIEHLSNSFVPNRIYAYR